MLGEWTTSPSPVSWEDTTEGKQKHLSVRALCKSLSVIQMICSCYCVHPCRLRRFAARGGLTVVNIRCTLKLASGDENAASRHGTKSRLGTGRVNQSERRCEPPPRARTRLPHPQRSYPQLSFMCSVPKSNAAGNAVRHRRLNGRPRGVRIYDSIAAQPPPLIPRVVLRFYGPRGSDAALPVPVKP